ncbi:hypothetical protein NDU88_001745 [Pleurodeles waltl]|uniref:Uncharacterized protein n=1 Tax=Pleurodeles waltl TaxID=8319 RepID=A0AAV7KQD2_PLEWA|nr:hypothetical protein NDU88_001745 [Pleurodeles waltl]
MQVRVPWTQAWLCTKDFRRKCTGAGVAAKVVVPSNAAQRGEARTYLHQTWTEESLDCGGHLDRVAGFEGPRSSCREETQGTGNAAFWCLRLQGEDSVDPREISSELLVQRGGRLPPQHAQAGKQSRRRQDQRYRVAVVVFATMLQVCRLPVRSAVDSLAEGEERDAEELG